LFREKAFLLASILLVLYSREMVLTFSTFVNYIGCIKEISRKSYATYEIKEYDFAIFEFLM